MAGALKGTARRKTVFVAVIVAVALLGILWANHANPSYHSQAVTYLRSVIAHDFAQAATVTCSADAAVLADPVAYEGSTDARDAVDFEILRGDHSKMDFVLTFSDGSKEQRHVPIVREHGNPRMCPIDQRLLGGPG